MSFKLVLDAGHGKTTLGKRCLKKLDPKQTREWVLNSRIVEKIQKLLEGYTGYELLRVDDPTGKIDVSLAKRTNAANKFKADFYLSVHHNAGIYGGKGGGIMSLVYTKASDESIAWQKALYNSLIEKTGLKGNRSKPMAKQNLHVCRETNMGAVMLELGFMDSSTDVPVILTEAFADKCAEAIVEVIVKRGGLKKKAAEVKKCTVNVAVLEKGHKGESVKALQIMLNGNSYNCGSADGSFGGATEKALNEYKGAHKLEKNGKCDEATWKSLLGV
jgi:N-acetylmuramoyl-L-alanine amidase